MAGLDRSPCKRSEAKRSQDQGADQRRGERSKPACKDGAEQPLGCERLAESRTGGACAGREGSAPKGAARRPLAAACDHQGAPAPPIAFALDWSCFCETAKACHGRARLPRTEPSIWLLGGLIWRKIIGMRLALSGRFTSSSRTPSSMLQT